MKSKKNNILILLFAFLTFILSCDSKEDLMTECSSSTEDSTSSFNLEPGSRRVMLAVLAGQQALTSPLSLKNATEISSDFNSNVFPFIIHDNIFSIPPMSGNEGLDQDFRTAESDLYKEQYGINAIPSTLISGIPYDSNSYSFPINQWRPKIEDLLEEERKLTIDFIVDYNQDTRSMEVSSKVKFHDSLNGTYRIVLATVEDNIIASQKNGTLNFPVVDDYPGGYVTNYLHRFSMRNHINGLQGELISEGLIDSGQLFDFSNTQILQTNFVEEEIFIYAYVYDSTTLEVLDVIYHKII